MSRVIYESEKRITQKFKPGVHRGVDLGWRKEEKYNKVYSNCEGVVEATLDNIPHGSEKGGGWGNYVLVKHPNNMRTRYAHLQKGLQVKKGQKVNENTVLGIIGNTGRSTGRHLHFEVQTGASTSTRINPEPYLTKPVYEKEEWTTGTYELLKSKYIRTSPEVANNYVLVKYIISNVQNKLVSQKANAKARFKIGARVEITTFKTDKKGNLWGKMKNTWICVNDSTGKQVKKI